MEEREIAVLRTICEYGVLNFTGNLKIGGLVIFWVVLFQEEV